MRPGFLMALKSIVCLVVGLALILVPTTVLPWFGITLDAGGLSVARLFGSAFLLIAVLLWMVKNIANTEVQRDIVLASFMGDGIGFVVALLSQLSGAVNPLGWVTVGVYLLFTLGFAYFLFVRPVETTHPSASGA